MNFYGWKPRVSAAQRRLTAARLSARANKAGAALTPVDASRGAIAKTFWGRAWCQNLERYSDFANRLPRGRTYLRSGSVIDLKISEGEVRAQVAGSNLYKVAVKIAAVRRAHWQSLSAGCSGSIDSLIELLQGRLSNAVMERICAPNTGLFPAPKDIEFSCSCPDWAFMCKHVAAALYGVGVRLDQQPELIFALRGVDAKDLVAQAGAGLVKSTPSPRAAKVLDHAVLGDVFGIELATAAAPAPAKAKAASKKTATASRSTTSKPAKPQRARPAPQRTVIVKKRGSARAAKNKAR